MDTREMFFLHVCQSFKYDSANLLYSHEFNKHISIKTNDIEQMPHAPREYQSIGLYIYYDKALIAINHSPSKKTLSEMQLYSNLIRLYNITSKTLL